MRHLRPPSPATVIALIALFVALGGTGYAASEIGSRGHGDSTAAKKKKKKALTEGRVNTLISNYFTKNKSTLLGPAGPPGAPGAAATKLFVQVNGTANPPTAVRGSGVVKIDGPTQTGTPGLFEVTFNRDLTSCVAVASRASADGNFPGIGGAAANHASANAISVQTFDNTNAAAAIPFSLVVLC